MERVSKSHIHRSTSGLDQKLSGELYRLITLNKADKTYVTIKGSFFERSLLLSPLQHLFD